MKLKVISLNIWHGGRLLDAALDFITKEQPDLLLMQEVYNEHDQSLEARFRTIDVLMDQFDFVDFDFAPAMLELLPEEKIEQGNAILSKLPITQRYEPIFFNEPYNDHYIDVRENFPKAPRNLQHVTVDAEGMALEVYNFQGVWDLDGDNNSPKRQRMGEVIIEAIQGRENIILGGDTNALPAAQAIKNIEQYLISVFKGELTTTFNVSRKDMVKFPGYGTSVVDMLFSSPNIKVIEHYCPAVDVSDHLPLVAILTIS